jgi:hypothetical protein
VDITKRRQKQRELMVRMVERKVRERAQQLYEERGQVDGQALKDWVQAESEVLDNSIVAPLYRRMKTTSDGCTEESPDLSTSDSTPCETTA